MKKTHGFAYVPDDGRPPRLIRYTDLPEGQAATLDYDKNLLRVDKQFFYCLTPTEQGYVLGTHTDLFKTTRGGRLSTTAHSSF